MLSAFVRAFKTPDLRKKLLFTLFIIAIYRLGTAVPTPGVAYTKVRECLSGADPQAATVLVRRFGPADVKWSGKLHCGSRVIGRGYAVDAQ